MSAQRSKFYSVATKLLNDYPELKLTFIMEEKVTDALNMTDNVYSMAVVYKKQFRGGSASYKQSYLLSNSFESLVKCFSNWIDSLLAKDAREA
jgi:hypothetical protein